MYSALLLTFVAAASTQQILQKLPSKNKIYQTMYKKGGAFYMVKSYISPTPPTPVSAKTVGDPDIQQNTMDPLHVALSALCGSPSHTQTNCPSTIRISANCTQEHNVFFRGCPVYKFESEVASLHFKHCLTLKAG